MTHVWHEGESTDVLEESLIQVWSTTSGEGPENVLAVIDVNVISHKNKTMDDVAHSVVNTTSPTFFLNSSEVVFISLNPS